MRKNMQLYNLEVMQKDIITNVAIEHKIDPELLTDELLEQVNAYMNKVLGNAKKNESHEDQMGYMVSSLILAALAIMEPKIISGD